MAEDRAILGEPALEDRVEAETGGDVFELREIADEMRCQPQNHRRFPLAGVPHVSLLKHVRQFSPLLSHAPVRGKQQHEIVALAIVLAGFEENLASRHDVAAMAVEEDDAAKPVHDPVVDEIAEYVEIVTRPRRERARKVKMVAGGAEPEQRREKNALV